MTAPEIGEQIAPDARLTEAFDAASEAYALVIEAARVLSKSSHPTTIIYALLSGEEQGLWGGTLLAETAKERGWDSTERGAGDTTNDRVEDGER